MKIPRTTLPFAVLALTPFFLSCESNSASIGGVENQDPLFEPRPCEPDDPRGRCDGDGGSGGSSGADSDLTLSGGYVAATAAADIGADNKKFLKVTSGGLTGSSGLTVAIDFDDTNISTCTGDLSLFSALDVSTSLAANFGMQIIKASVLNGVRDPANWIRMRRSEDDIEHPFVVLNFSTGTEHPDALVTLLSGDINDASQPRVLRFSEGAVRVTRRIDVNTSTTMICDQAPGDEVVVTIEPPSS